MYETVKKEKALLVMIEAPAVRFSLTYRPPPIGLGERPGHPERQSPPGAKRRRWPIEILTQEFKNLVHSTEICVVDCVVVKIARPSPSLYLGKGKAEELSIIVQEKDINVVIFNNNLNFTQQRNLEDVLGTKVIDRTQLILDIFAHHAQTQEGSLQVELAQLEYLLPRLKGKGIMLSRLGAGIGTIGPGEKKLEVDRRRISERITRLKKELEKVRKHREIMRKKRQKERINVCSLVGYTNAGKSTLFNVFTESKEPTSPSLFTTLDTVSHILILHNSLKVLLTDTVGFLYQLPPNLIAAFKATLEELSYADTLLCVVDASSPDILRRINSVNSILKDLELDKKPTILIFNKIDQIDAADLHNLKTTYPEAVFISALKKLNLHTLRERIYEVLFKDMQEAILKFPFKLMEVVNYIHKNCEVIKTNYQESNVVYWVRAKNQSLVYLKARGVTIEKV